MTRKIRKASFSSFLCGSAAVAALALGLAAWQGFGASSALAEQGGTQAHGSGMGGQKGGAGAGGDHMQGKGGRSLQDIFRDVTGVGGGEDSDAPEWAGQPGGKSGMGGGQPGSAGSKKGDLFGYLWVILRDDNGVPILSAEGFVQPLDAEGNLIPLDEEGKPIDESLTVEVEIGRLNVGRAPTKVLDRRAEEVVTLLNSATDVSVDAAGRLVLTVDGEAKTIDSPLENLALYVALMTDGTIAGVSDLPGTDYDFLVDGKLTTEDLAAAASFLAAATDKDGAFTADEVAYIDAFLGINLVKVGDVTYSNVDYSTFSYDRSDTYENATATVLVEQSDGSWVPQTVNVYDTVFASTDYSGTGTLSAYTQAADDARAVIEFIHEYAVPVTVSN